MSLVYFHSFFSHLFPKGELRHCIVMKRLVAHTAHRDSVKKNKSKHHSSSARTSEGCRETTKQTKCNHSREWKCMADFLISLKFRRLTSSEVGDKAMKQEWKSKSKVCFELGAISLISLKDPKILKCITKCQALYRGHRTRVSLKTMSNNYLLSLITLYQRQEKMWQRKFTKPNCHM